MDQEVIRRRNTVFNIIYRRVTLHYTQFVPKAARWTLEITCLLLALLTLAFWSYVHFTYVVDPDDCLVHIKERPFSSEVILQVEVYTNTTELWRKTQSSLHQMPRPLLVTEKGTFRLENYTAEKEEKKEHSLISQLKEWLHEVFHLTKDKVQETTAGQNEDEKDLDVSLYELLDIYTLKLYSIDYTILEFAREPGYLQLTPSARERLNISTRRLYINPENATCFGGGFGQFITKYLLGYDMMIIASFKNLLPVIQGSGYVKNLLTGSYYYYRVQWMGKWRYITGLLPTLFFTLVASVLLRQIHYHVFKFLTHFHHLMNEGIPMPIQTGAQVPFLIVTYAAIGLVIVMSEALGDDSLFSLLMVATVWEADQFYALFCRHKASKMFFPMFFFLYHAIPYAYFIRFNGQFWFLPFVFHWFLLQNAVLFFFHHFEVNEQQHIALAADQHHQHRFHIHLMQEQLRVEQPNVQDQQQLLLELHPPPLLVERNLQTADTNAEQSDDQVDTPTPSSPVEESSAEGSALFISTQTNNTSPSHSDSHSSASFDVRDTSSAPRLRDIPQRDGLRERQLIRNDRQGSDP